MSLPHGDALRAAVDVLDRLGVEHVLFGGNAQNIWGDPRFTKDADLVIQLPDDRFEELLGALAGSGFQVDLARHLDRLIKGRIVKIAFQLVSVDFVIGETDFDRSALRRRLRVEYLGVPIHVVSPEDLVLYKLIAHRPQDLADLDKIFRRQRARLDDAYLDTWAQWLVRETGLTHIQTTLAALRARLGT